jgi:hypothetical protein
MAAGIPDALGDAIAADATLTGWLATYRGAPAIFSADLAPPDATMPYCLIGPTVTDPGGPLLDGTESGSRDVVRDIRLFGPATGSVAAIDAAAERLRSVLSGRLLSVPGYQRARVSIVAGPLGVSADDDAYGRLVSLRVHLTR